MKTQFNNLELGQLSIALENHLDTIDKDLQTVTGEDKATLQYVKGDFQELKNKVDSNSEPTQEDMKKHVQQYYRDNEGIHLPLDKIQVDVESGRVDFDEDDLEEIQSQNYLTDEIELSFEAKSDNKELFFDFIEQAGINRADFKLQTGGIGSLEELANMADNMRSKYPDSKFRIIVNNICFSNYPEYRDLPF